MTRIRLTQYVSAAVFAFAASGNAQAYDYLLLAASWQPGFCATHSGKPECDTVRGSYAANNFIVHGLWPNDYDGSHPFYCGVSQTQINLDKPGTWCNMAAYGASSTTLNNLAPYMPGIASCLDKHEWYKHGSCYGATPDSYWNTSSSLITRLNTTSFASFVRNNAGKYVTRSQLLSAFGNAFGSGSTAAVSLQCTRYNNVSYFTEAWVNLNNNTLGQFPALASLELHGAISGTCPSSSIYIARP